MSQATTSITKLKKGYTVRIKGAAADGEVVDRLSEGGQAVALSPARFRGLKPRLDVQEGDTVRRGTQLFHDKKNPAVVWRSPVAGKIKAIDIGRRRVINSIQIEVDGEDAEVLGLDAMPANNEEEARQLLLKSGLWPVIQASPKLALATPDSQPKVIVVEAHTRESHGWSAELIAGEYSEDLAPALKLLGKICSNIVILNEAGKVPPALAGLDSGLARQVEIEGKGGTEHAGAYLFHNERLNKGEVYWKLDLQGLGLIGRALRTGHYPGSRIVALHGTELVKEKRAHYRIWQGMALDQFLQGSFVNQDPKRVVCGGVLTGDAVDENGFLAYHHSNVSVLRLGRPRRLFNFFRLGFAQPTYSKAYVAGLLPGEYQYEADTNGEERACIQCGYCTEICPVDLMPDFSFKASLAMNYDNMEAHEIRDCTGCGLCAFVCPSKIDIPAIIRDGIYALEDD